MPAGRGLWSGPARSCGVGRHAVRGVTGERGVTRKKRARRRMRRALECRRRGPRPASPPARQPPRLRLELRLTPPCAFFARQISSGDPRGWKTPLAPVAIGTQVHLTRAAAAPRGAAPWLQRVSSHDLCGGKGQSNRLGGLPGIKTLADCLGPAPPCASLGSGESRGVDDGPGAAGRAPAPLAGKAVRNRQFAP